MSLNMKKIKLLGKYAIAEHEFALVDDDDFEEIAKFKWYVMLVQKRSHYKKLYYSYRGKKIKGKSIKTLMHRQVMSVKDRRQVDHKNHNGLDNQKHNLRIATHQQNASNKSIIGNKTSKYKGVRFNPYYETVGG
jgi:hypothetical protein